MEILFDSSVAVAFERQQLDLETVLAKHADDCFFLSSVTLAELWYGARKRPLRYRARAETFIAQLLARFPVITFDNAAADVHATLRLPLERTGASLGHNDLLIASTAIAHRMAIAARDRDFGRIDGLTVLRW